MLIAMELEERLGELGYDVRGPFHNLPAAYAGAAAQRPDAALLDANLNGQSSVELGAKLAEQGVPVAFCTGYDALKGAPPSLANAPVLIKPLSDAALRDALKRLLG